MKIIIDLSPRAIALRFEEVNQLVDLCLSLGNTDIGRRIRENRLIAAPEGQDDGKQDRGDRKSGKLPSGE